MTVEERIADALPVWRKACTFAACRHEGQRRKDGRTPAIAHAMRVVLTVRDVFGCGDAEVMAAALLHDTIEDTTTDYDDVLEACGRNVADWVATLTKDKRIEEQEREERFLQAVAAGPWQVRLVKFADVYDNVIDAEHMSEEKRGKIRRKARTVLRVLDTGDGPTALQTAHRELSRLLDALQVSEV